MAPKLVALFRDYEAAHRHPVNIKCHEVAIPLIVFHVVGMLSWISVGPTTLAHLAYVAAVAWYVSLDRKLGVIMAALYAACLWMAARTPAALVIVAAVVGWGVQLGGHSIWERNRPAFTRNLLHALVGPLYFVARRTGDWPRAS